MDALSALKMTVGPADMESKLKSIVEQSAAKSIPAQDLEKLNAATGSDVIQSTQPAQSPSSFQNVLGNFIGEVNAQQTAAGDAVSGLLSGKNVSLHQAMISMEEASVSFQMMVEVRNKLLDSYQELMRMSV